MAERFPLAPEELEAEEHEALQALSEEKAHHRAAIQAQLANVPTWGSQLTSRGIIAGLVLGSMFLIVVHKLNLGVGIIPSLNIAAGLLAFCSLKIWAFMAKWLWPHHPVSPFGAQECNVVQTFITACSSVAFTGGFGSYLTALDKRSFNLLGGDTAVGNRAEDVYEPSLQRVIPYLLCTSVIGVFMLVALRKTLIIDYNLTYPSGTATGLMIHSFFTQRGEQTAGKQLGQLARFFGISVVWDAFKWLFSGVNCAFCSVTNVCGGFEKFPVFGLTAARWTFFLNITPNIVGAGMICPHIVNMSMLAGAVLTWGFLWPYIASKEGDWFDAGQDETSFAGLFGYKVFLTIALLMGDGLYSLIKVMSASARAFWAAKQRSKCCGQRLLAQSSFTPDGSSHGDKSHKRGHAFAPPAAAHTHGYAPVSCSGVNSSGRDGACSAAGVGVREATNSEQQQQEHAPLRSLQQQEQQRLQSTQPVVTNGGQQQQTPQQSKQPVRMMSGGVLEQEQPVSWEAKDGGGGVMDSVRGSLGGQLKRKASSLGSLLKAGEGGGGANEGCAHEGHDGEGGCEGREEEQRLVGVDAGVHSSGEAPVLDEAKLENDLQKHVFVSDVIPNSISFIGYVTFGVLGTFIIPLCYPAVKWYYVVTGFLVAPLMALPVSFGCGLTDWDVSSMMGKLAIFAFAAWAGLQGGGVVAGLAMAGVVVSATSTSATLMQDFRTGFIVCCAPKAMFAAQLLGALAGALLAPLTFALFWSTGKVGDPLGPYPAPYAAIFRAMAIFGTQGMGVLPKNCDTLMLVFFLGAIVINLMRDFLPPKVSRFIPIPMAMAIPFVLGAFIAIDMALGSLIVAIWEWKDAAAAELLAPAVASGLIVGDGVFSLPLSLMGMLNIQAPFCMAFGAPGAPTAAGRG